MKQNIPSVGTYVGGVMLSYPFSGVVRERTETKALVELHGELPPSPRGQDPRKRLVFTRSEVFDQSGLNVPTDWVTGLPVALARLLLPLALHPESVLAMARVWALQPWAGRAAVRNAITQRAVQATRNEYVLEHIWRCPASEPGVLTCGQVIGFLGEPITWLSDQIGHGVRA